MATSWTCWGLAREFRVPVLLEEEGANSRTLMKKSWSTVTSSTMYGMVKDKWNQELSFNLDNLAIALSKVRAYSALVSFQ